MRACPILLVPLLLVASVVATQATDEPPIDVARGKELMRKFRAGETLTPEEQAYFDRVRREIRKRAAARQQGRVPNTPARPFVVDRSDWERLVPITPTRSPWETSSRSSSRLMVVLPLVPVRPIMVRSCAGKP